MVPLAAGLALAGCGVGSVEVAPAPQPVVQQGTDAGLVTGPTAEDLERMDRLTAHGSVVNR